jgi:O-methyltransferase
MLNTLKGRLANWKASPQKWQITYIWSRLTTLSTALLRKRRESKEREKLLSPAIETEYVAILFDAEFRSSVTQVRDYTCLDIARLANLWNLARLVGPGIFLEVGSYKGGTALHICNAIEHRGASLYCFDPFEKGGFEKLNHQDTCFKPGDFTDTRYEAVVRLLSSKPNARVIQGFFPAAAESLNLRDIAFCHLDVDVYEATKDSLEYMAPRLAARSLIVVDDVDHRETPGVNKAVADFLASHPSFIFIPMFPTQAVLLPKFLW